MALLNQVLGGAPGELLVPDIAQDYAVQLHESLQSSHLEPVVPGFKILYLTQDQEGTYGMDIGYPILCHLTKQELMIIGLISSALFT